MSGSTTQHGYLLLADISGYTSFVAGTELEHSQDILSELLEVIITKIKPQLAIHKMAGDAVFAYAPDDLFAVIESYEHIGDIQTYSLDLYQGYQEITEALRISVSPEAAHQTLTDEYGSPPHIIWEWFNDPSSMDSG